MDVKSQSKSNEISNNKISNLPKINNDKNIKYNKVIKVLLDNESEIKNKTKDISNLNNDNNDINKSDDFKNNFYKYNFEQSEKIESLKDLKLIKNTIGEEKIEPMKIDKNMIKYNLENKKIKTNAESNLKKKEDKNKIERYKEENNKNGEKGELDLSYNFEDDALNVTQQQMEIMDNEVNKIYNKYKNNIKIKNFKMNHPLLKYNIKEKAYNNLDFGVYHMTKEERQKRLYPLLEKQKIILEKIKKDNISRSNISSSNNNDSDNQTQNKINKSNKLFSPFKLNQFDINDNGYNNINLRYNNHQMKPYFNHNNNMNKNLMSYNYQNNSIQRYQNLYNNGSLSTQTRTNNSANDKNNLKLSNNKKITYEPYTLLDYKKKFDNDRENRIQLGGLGANIGGEDWIKRQKNLERKMKYSEYVKSDNEEDIKNQKKFKTRLKKENYEISKTISSKKSSEFSSDNKKYRAIHTENNIVNNKKFKLPLIKERFNNNNINNIKKDNFKRNFNNMYSNQRQNIKENYSSEKNQIYQNNDSEKDLKELIRKYEEYNGKF